MDVFAALKDLAQLDRHAGYEVDLAANGTDGTKRLESHGYDLVLLDLMMPDRSGMDVLRDVRDRDRETPIFMITAFGSTETAVHALKLGANDYFTKPWENDKLLIEIDRTIAERRLLYENTHLKQELRDAWKKRIKTLHPDAHPGASEEQIARLTEECQECDKYFRMLLAYFRWR